MAGGDIAGYGGKMGWSAGLGKWLDDPSSKVNRYWRQIEDGSGGDWSGRTVAGLWADTIGNGPLEGSPFNPGERTQKLRPAFRKGTAHTPEGMLGAARYALLKYLDVGKGKKGNTERMDELNVRYVWVYKYEHRGKHRSRVPGSGEMRAPRTMAETRRAQQSLIHFFMTKTESAAHIPFVAGVIVRPIEARHYYAKAIEEFKPRIKEMELEGLRIAAKSTLMDVNGQLVTGSEFSRFRAAAAKEDDTYARKGHARQEQTDAGMARYAPEGGAVITIAATAQVQFSARNGPGGFINGYFQDMMREVNARVAAAYLQEVARLMEPHRPGTGDLIKATLDYRNRYPDDEF